MPEPNRLAPPADEIRKLGVAAVELMAEYYEGIAGRRVMPDATSQELRALVEESLPRSGMAANQLFDLVRDVVFRFNRHNGHPRFFGYVASPGTPIGAIADMLTATLNANVTSWRSAPAATEIEHVTVGWLKEMLGYPAEAVGLFLSGGSMGNFAGLAAARAAKGHADFSQTGALPGGRAMRVYVSEEAHFSIRKAAGLLGIGEANVRAIGTDARLRMDPEQLRKAVREDEESGHLPICVAATAGTVGAGAFDPLDEIGEVAREHGLWLHVDAAYGGFAALALSARHLFGGIGRADSITLDPHKWLYLPTGCGCVLYRDPASARAAFGHDADYVSVLGRERDEAFAFWDYGPELSRRFRALDVWLLVKFAGSDALGEAVERNMACARYFEQLVTASEDFKMLAPVELSIFCFRCAPRSFAGDLDAFNEKILLEVQREGSSYISNTRVRGRFALRGCVLNHRTTERDMEILLEDVRCAARRVLSAGPA